MSWQTVEAHIKFWNPGDNWGSLPDLGGGFSTADQTFILSYLNQMYSGSTEAAQLLENWTSANRDLRLYRTATQPGMSALPNPDGSPKGIAGFNLNIMNNWFEFNDKGIFASSRPSLIILHELSHAIGGTRDPIGSGRVAV